MVLISFDNPRVAQDKSQAILPFRQLKSRPTLFFCGDGISGRSSFVPFSLSVAFISKLH